MHVIADFVCQPCAMLHQAWLYMMLVCLTLQEDVVAGGAASGAAAASADPLVNLLDLDDVFGAPAPPQPASPALVLEARPVLEPAVFQVGVPDFVPLFKLLTTVLYLEEGLIIIVLIGPRQGPRHLSRHHTVPVLVRVLISGCPCSRTRTSTAQ